MTQINKKLKNIETSCKALGAAMFMFTVCLYMAIGALFALVSDEAFYYHIAFAFIIQGIIVSLVASTVWMLCFLVTKSWGFITRYLLALGIWAVLFVISMLVPIISVIEGHLIWVICSAVSTLIFGTAVAVASNMHFRKTGTRSVLLWEIN